MRALEALERVIDARVFVRAPASSRWRLLSLEQAKALWGFRGRLDAPELAR